MAWKTLWPAKAIGKEMCIWFAILYSISEDVKGYRPAAYMTEAWVSASYLSVMFLLPVHLITLNYDPHSYAS